MSRQNVRELIAEAKSGDHPKTTSALMQRAADSLMDMDAMLENIGAVLADKNMDTARLKVQAILGKAREAYERVV